VPVELPPGRAQSYAETNSAITTTLQQ